MDASKSAIFPFGENLKKKKKNQNGQFKLKFGT